MRKALQILLASLFFLKAAAQTVEVTGRVTDSQGQPVVNATVTEKGTQRAAVSNAEGRFTLSVRPGATLVISSVGFGQKEVKVGNSNTVAITMEPEDANLTEVVVTAFGVRREKRGLSSAVTDIKSDQFVQKSEPDILRSLNGKVPGVNITSGGGAPGQSTKINIRGITSFSGNNQPLIVVDGIPFDNSVNNAAGFQENTVFSNRLYDIDPNSIESITVLKGANAAALYGSGAQNGAIVITTKSGNKARNRGLEVTYNTSYAQERVSNIPDYQNIYGQGSNQNYNGGFIGNWGAPFGFQRDAVNAQLGYQRYNTTNAPDSVPHPVVSLGFTSPRFASVFPNLIGTKVPYVPHDIVGGFFQPGHVVENSININSFQGKTGLNAGISRMTNEGIVNNSQTSRTSLSFGGNTVLANGLTVTGNVNYVNNQQQSPQSGASFFADYVGSSEAFSSIYARLFYLPRNYNLNEYPFETPDGRNVFYRALDNPHWIAKYNLFNSEVNRAFGNLSFSYDPLKWLNLTARGGINTYSDHQTNYLRPGGTAVAEGRYWEANFQNETMNYTFLATVKTELTKDLDLRTVVGADYLQRYNRFSRNTGLGIIDPSIKSLRNTEIVTNNFDGFERRRKIGALADVQLNFRDYLYLNVTGRNDWTSTLPQGDNDYFFPSVGLGFVFTDALNLKSDRLTYGKVRLSAVRVANDPDPYQLITTYSINPAGGAYVANSGTKFNYASLSNELKNANLVPEQTSEIEAGLELQLFKSRVGVDLTFFKKNTKDQIVSVGTPASTGFTSRIVNAGEVENKGIELGLNVTPVQTQSFQWRTTFNFNLIRSQVIDAGPNGEIFLGGSGLSSTGTIIRAGQPFGMIYGTKNARDAEGNLLIDERQGRPFPLPTSQIIGNPNPDFTLGINNSISFKGFSLGALVDYRHGGDIYSVTAASLLLRGQLNNKYSTDREGVRIIPGVYGDPQTYQAILDANKQPIRNTTAISAFDYHFTNGFGAYGADEVNVYDATVIRLREVTLGYEVPKKVLGRTPFGSARLSLSGRNLWFRAPNMLEGLNFDPEVLSSFSQSNVQGFDFGASPSTRRLGINLSVTF